MQEFNIRDLRQHACRERAIRARMYARILMPVFVFAAATCVWQDQDMRDEVTAAILEIRPMVASYLVDTPLENMLGPLTVEDTTDADDHQLADASALPTSSVPINRP
ncbi:MAG: hypothetical protein V2I76_12790 [Roseobacter sp.]|jgi:hypothetical protein|nr:hypothetical protein [Roseobacter sp.]